MARVQGQACPKGLGAISLVTLAGAVCDWGRFSNRKQIGSYTGCGPGEHRSSGNDGWGAFGRMGNGRGRCLLAEAVRRCARMPTNANPKPPNAPLIGSGDGG